MTREEAIKDFIKIEYEREFTVISVATIEWVVHAPVNSWKKMVELPWATEQQIQQEIDNILSKKKYFKICKECNQLSPVGWMHDTKICQTCATENHGIVY